MVKNKLVNCARSLTLVIIFLNAAKGYPGETELYSLQPPDSHYLQIPPPLPSPRSILLSGYQSQDSNPLAALNLSNMNLIHFQRFIQWIEEYFSQGKFREYKNKINAAAILVEKSKIHFKSTPSNRQEPEPQSGSDTDTDTDTESTEETTIDGYAIKDFTTLQELENDCSESMLYAYQNDQFIKLKEEVKEKNIDWNTIKTETIPEGYPYQLVWDMVRLFNRAFNSNEKLNNPEDDFFKIIKNKDPALDVIIKIMINAMYKINETDAYITTAWLKYILIEHQIHFDIDNWLSRRVIQADYSFNIADDRMIIGNKLTPEGEKYVKKYNLNKKTVMKSRAFSTTKYSSKSLWIILMHFYKKMSLVNKNKEHKELSFEDLFQDDPLFTNTFIPILNEILSCISCGLESNEKALLVLWIDNTFSDIHLQFNWRRSLRNHPFMPVQTEEPPPPTQSSQPVSRSKGISRKRPGSTIKEQAVKTRKKRESHLPARYRSSEGKIIPRENEPQSTRNPDPDQSTPPGALNGQSTYQP